MKTSTNYLTNCLKDSRTLAQLKKEAKERGIVPAGDKRLKATWTDALATPAPTPPKEWNWRMQNIKYMWSLKDLKARASTYEIIPTGNKNLKETWIIALGLK